MRPAALTLSWVCFSVAVAASGADRPAGTTPAADEAAIVQHAEVDGIRVDLRITPLEDAGGDAAPRLRENQLVRFSLALADTTSAAPLGGLYPAAWLDRLPPGEAMTRQSCVDKLETFVGASILQRAELDLNAYYVLTMNDDATLSVVDPLFGFGGSQLLAMVALRAPAADWVLEPRSGRIFVSMPAAGSVAVVETQDWQVVTAIPTAPSPARLALQRDGVYLWVGYEQPETGADRSGVAVIQAPNLAERTRIETGRGPHDIVLDPADRFAYVSNRGDGTVSVIDVATLTVVRSLATGPEPVSMTWSDAASALYVAHAGDGSLVAIDGERHEITSRLAVAASLGQARAAPGGRLVLALAPRENLLAVVDTARGTVVQRGPVAAEPAQISFTRTLAYIWHRGSEDVLMVPLAELGEPGRPIPVVDFPGGRLPPGAGGTSSLAPAIVKAPGASAVLVSNPADRMIYYYMEGMAAPMGAFENQGRRPRAVMVVDNSLRERAPGVYETTARLRRPGRYDLAFFLDAPRLIHCFPLDVAVDPALEAKRARLPLELRVIGERGHRAVAVGETLEVVVEAVDPAADRPRSDLADLEVMVMLAPGQWHQTVTAEALGEGRYRARIALPREGLYYVYAASTAEGLALGTTRPLLYAVASAN